METEAIIEHSNKSKSNTATKLNSDLKLNDGVLTERTETLSNIAPNEEKKPITTPRVRSEKPTTKPLHLGKEDANRLLYNSLTVPFQKVVFIAGVNYNFEMRLLVIESS